MIILVEIPLAILFSLTALSWLGETINVMTLGGLALAVGILVDDGTVTIENINYHLELGKRIEPAILDGAQQIVIPAFVTLLCLRSCSFRCFSSAASPATCSARWPRRWCSRCSAPSSYRARWCRRWPTF